MTEDIKHVWFDFSETLASLKTETHDRLRYATYAEVVHRPVDEELIDEFEQLYTKYHHSNAAVFRSIGLPSGFWSERINSVNPSELYQLADSLVPQVLDKLKDIIAISIFSNINLDNVLPSLGINPEWFTHILSSGMVKEPKPALDGFHKMVELSAVPAGEVLYIGDDIGKDILPAKQVGIKTGLMWKISDQADFSFMNFREVLDLFAK